MKDTIYIPQFVKKLWNGDYGLAVTYWIYGVIIPHIIVVVSVIFDEMGYPFFMLVTIVFFVIATPVILVGIWNAADRYEGPYIWANLAKVAVVLSIVLTLGNLMGL